MQNILTLIRAVSASSLSGFALEEGDFRLSLSRSGQPLAGTLDGLPGNLGGLNGQKFPEQTPGRTTAAGNGQLVTGAAMPEKTEAVMDAASGTCVKSPLVGTFYASSGPEEAPFVSVGDTVKKGQVLGIVEAMKLMNEIESETDGVVKAIYVENEQMVEYGQPMFLIG